MAEPRSPRRSLRRRLALWMTASTALTMVLFALLAYVFVVLEERDEQTSGQSFEPTAEIEADARDDVLLAMAVAAPVALGVAVGGGLWLSRRALAPLYETIRTADEMSVEDLHRRLAVPGADDELAELATSLNRLFARLEDGFSALERYAADASHELRTPLAVIASELEVALRHPRGEQEWRRVAATSLDELQRLTRLVEALLELARLGSAPAAAEPLSLGELVEQATAPATARAGERRIEMTTEIEEPAAPQVRGHPEALSVAIGNLVDNALRYTPAGGEIRVSVEARSGGVLAVLVDDSGPGVDDEERDRVFEPFARGAAGRAADRGGESSAGLGLGLATSRRIARAHGGHLAVEDSPLGGARFALTLPAAAKS